MNIYRKGGEKPTGNRIEKLSKCKTAREKKMHDYYQVDEDTIATQIFTLDEELLAL